jgi:hypothetical protein
MDEAIAAKKKRLDELRPLSAKALADFEHYYDIELTCTSNAIEGNTLSPVETTLVIEHGITVSDWCRCLRSNRPCRWRVWSRISADERWDSVSVPRGNQVAVTQSVLYSPLGAALSLVSSNPNPTVSFSDPLPGLVNS